MNIAYISFEHPLGKTGGGIGIYIDQIATIMASRGHSVEVFTSTITAESTSHEYKNYQVHLIPAKNIDDFRTAVAPAFDSYHQKKPFDAIETAEYGADALAIKQNNPGIPLVVKLHTPTFLVNRLNFVNPSLATKARFIIGGILKGHRPKLYWKRYPKNDLEKSIYHLADAITSPSKSLSQIVIDEWGARNIILLPNPYVPSQRLLSLQHRTGNKKVRVLFIGRLEQRKGIYTLLSAIPEILKQNKNISFAFAGADQPSHKKNISVKTLMLKKLRHYATRLDFLGHVDNTKLHEIFANTDICVLPSIWENFPTVCLEIMAAGVPVIGSKAGGMAEIITHEKDGLLVSSNSPQQIVAAILKLAADVNLRQLLGLAARQTILTRYNAEKIGAENENVFRSVIRK